MSQSVFDGDGRFMVQPTVHLPGTYPIAVRRSTARLLIEAFNKSGGSNHSGQGATLWVLLQHLQDTKQPYVLRAQCGEFYQLERLKI